MTRSLLLVAVLALPACRTDQTLVAPDPHLERMLEQPKRLPYDDDPAMPGGQTMQRPPPGTLSVDAPVVEGVLVEGVADGRWAERIPVALDAVGLRAGRRHFETFCAPCHGELGDGDSVVATKMRLRKPQDLLADSVRAYPPGRIFQTIRQGYGLMPSYRVQLDVDATWDVVAYVRALQLAGGARVADLPADVRDRLAKEAP